MRTAGLGGNGSGTKASKASPGIFDGTSVPVLRA